MQEENQKKVAQYNILVTLKSLETDSLLECKICPFVHFGGSYFFSDQGAISRTKNPEYEYIPEFQGANYFEYSEMEVPVHIFSTEIYS